MLTNNLIRQAGLLRNSAKLPHWTPIFKRNHFVDGGGESTLNDMPIPAGDYNEWYAKRNAKYNALLAGGVAALISAIIMCKNSNKIVYNYSVPAYEY